MAVSLIDRSRSGLGAALRLVEARARGHAAGAIVPSATCEPEAGLHRAGTTAVAPVDYGVETLHRVATVDRYNDWIYRRIEPHLGGRILEVGCGLGNMTKYFLGRDQLVSLDILPASVDQVRGLYGSRSGFEVHCADVCDQLEVERLRPYRFDTVVCLNVLEHILDDTLALQHMASLLEPGGKLILFVPAGKYLYGELDIALSHHRRYDRQTVLHTVSDLGLTPELLQYMNPAGIPGWFLASRILKRHAPPRGLLHLFNFLTPLFLWMEEQVEMPIGLSILSVSRRETA